MNAFLRGLIAAAVTLLPGYAQAGGCYRSNCYIRPTYVNRQVVVKKVAEIQFQPTFVSFVPSQVSLNAAVIQYPASASALTYSYQGLPAVASTQPQAQAYQQPGYVPQSQAAPQGAGGYSPQNAGYPPQNGQPAPQAEIAAKPAQPMGQLEAIAFKLDRLLDVLGGGKVQAMNDEGEVALYTNCKSCHQAGGSNAKAIAALVMFDDQGNLIPKLPRGRIYLAIHNGTMPPSGKLADPARESIRKWAQPPTDLEY